MSDLIDHSCPVRMIGTGTPHHFFGYYNKSTWSPDGTMLLSNRVPMLTGDLIGTEVAQVGYFDLEDDDRFHTIGETTTCN